MHSTAVPKFRVASELLERALELYLRKDSYYAALHLAGAAEEVLAVYARAAEKTHGTCVVPMFDAMKSLVAVIDGGAEKSEMARREQAAGNRMNDPKNSVKHMHGGSDNGFTYDVVTESTDMIEMAISNYRQLQPLLRLPELRDTAPFFAVKQELRNRQQESARCLTPRSS